MSLTMPTLEENPRGNTVALPDGARILIVCDSDREAERLKSALSNERAIPECVSSMTQGCEAAKSGRFQVIFSAPQLIDGSWTRLVDIANHYDLHFEVVLWARNFDLFEWARALNEGAFDVLDSMHEQRKVAEVTKRALWAAFLMGAGPRRPALDPRLIA
jgi:DNA-binding NtrC family response regulator